MSASSEPLHHWRDDSIGLRYAMRPLISCERCGWSGRLQTRSSRSSSALERQAVSAGDGIFADHRDEALTTLRDETVVFEAAFLDRTEAGDFLIYVMKAESFEKSNQAAATSTHDIDKYHQEFKREDSLVRAELIGSAAQTNHTPITDGTLPMTAIPRAARPTGRSLTRGVQAAMPPSVPPPSAAA